MLGSGYTVGQGGGCLDKAWVGFMRAKRLENHKDMTLYASIIQRVEKELIEISQFPELGLCFCEPEEDESAIQGQRISECLMSLDVLQEHRIL